MEERFWSKVAKTKTCWLWLGGINGKGYGNFSCNARTVSAHRIAYELAYGSIPEGMVVCHTCDVPACVNPEHLFLGTMKDNNQDKMLKGRHRHGRGPVGKYGEDNPRSILSREIVADIRQALSEGFTQTQVAKRYGISQSHVSRIKNGRVW